MWYVKNRCMNSEQTQNILLWPYLKVPEVKSIAENMKNRLKKIIFPFSLVSEPNFLFSSKNN